jgi:hypothetical protein
MSRVLKWSINPITNPNPVYSHSITWQYTGYLFFIGSLILQSKVAFKKSHPVKKFPAFYGTLWFIILLTRSHQLNLSWTRLIQSTSSPHFLNINFNIILSFMPKSHKLSLSFLQVSWRKFSMHFSSPLSLSHAMPISFTHYLVNSTKYEAPHYSHYVFFSSLPLLPLCLADTLHSAQHPVFKHPQSTCFTDWLTSLTVN